MVGAIGSGDGSGILELIRLLLREPNGEGLDRLIAEPAHDRRNGRRVDATREDPPQRHVRHQAHAYRFGKALGEFPDELLVRLVRAAGGGEAQVPVLSNLQCSVSPPQRMARRQPLDAGEQRCGPGGSAVGKIVRQRGVIQLRSDRLGREQRLDFRREVERPVIRVHVVQRLLTHTIPGEEELLAATVPDGEGEHPPELVDGPRALFLVQPEDGLGIAASAVAMAAALEGGAQLGMVVDLAVIHDVERSAVVVHRLMPARNVDDRETAMRQSDASLVEDAEIVRAPMRHGIPHPDELEGIYRAPRTRRKRDSANPAHTLQLTSTGAGGPLEGPPLPTDAARRAPPTATRARASPPTTIRSAPRRSSSHPATASTSTWRSRPCRRAAM